MRISLKRQTAGRSFLDSSCNVSLRQKVIETHHQWSMLFIFNTRSVTDEHKHVIVNFHSSQILESCQKCNFGLSYHTTAKYNYGLKPTVLRQYISSLTEAEIAFCMTDLAGISLNTYEKIKIYTFEHSPWNGEKWPHPIIQAVEICLCSIGLHYVNLS